MATAHETAALILVFWKALKMARNRLTTRTLSSLEQLECRTLLSNFVKPVLSGQGVLKVQGDDQDNAFAVEKDGESIRVRGMKETVVAGQSVFPMPSVRKLKIVGGRGSDSVYVDDFSSKVKTKSVESRLAIAAVPAPRIIDIKPISDTSVLVTYDRAMGPSALDPANYTITDDDGQPLQVSGADFVGQVASMVEVRTAPQSYTNYTFNVQNMADSTGQQVFFDGRKFSGNPKASVVSVAAISPTTVVVAFNEPMADSALAPQHYTIRSKSNGQALLVTDAQFDGPLGMVVVLTTAPQSALVYDFVAATNITDLGNENLVNLSATFTGMAAPALIRAVPTQPTRLVLTFTGPVGDSALAPSTYEIVHLTVDADGNDSEVGNLPISAATFLGGQRTVVELVTAAQADATYRITTTTALSDVVGSPLPVASAIFNGIAEPVVSPMLVSAISTSPNVVLVTYSEPMSDDALSPSSHAVKTTAAPQTALRVLTARFVGTERRVLELATDPQGNGTEYTITSNATDLDGNAVPSSSNRTFSGVGAASDKIPGPPAIVGAISVSNTVVRVHFSEPMGNSALEPGNYRFTVEGQPAGALTVPAQVAATPSVQARNGGGFNIAFSADPFFHEAVELTVTDDTTNGAGVTATLANGVYAIELGGATGGTFKLQLAGTTTKTDVLGHDVTKATLQQELAKLVAKPPIRWLNDSADTVVEIAVLSQSEATYKVSVFSLRDNAGNPMPERPFLNVTNVLVEPNSTTFAGLPPGGTPLDSDADGLTDSEEQRGYVMNVRQVDGSVVTRTVTSDPLSADTDQDGIGDFDERHYLANPRTPDTDHDGLTDYQELNEIYSGPASQDSDGDGLTDGLEFNFFRTSPLHSDTDGDQRSPWQTAIRVWRIFPSRESKSAASTCNSTFGFPRRPLQKPGISAPSR
jgi:hypothetical protein